MMIELAAGLWRKLTEVAMIISIAIAMALKCALQFESRISNNKRHSKATKYHHDSQLA